MTLLVVTVVLALALAAPVAAHPNPFRNSSSTADGHHTWDSDMINIEDVSETGAGVYVAVLDTGLAKNWTDYFPRERVRTDLGTGFYQPIKFSTMKDDPCLVEAEFGDLRETSWQSARGSTHGTHVASTIIGYSYYSNHDLAEGFPLPPIQVRGIAPDATIIPIKVLDDYQLPALPRCEEPVPSELAVFGTDEMVAAGINYATDLALAGHAPMVINMSLGGDELDDIEKEAIDRAIASGVIVVAAAGNEGEEGMSFPGAYAPVISAGAAGWTGEWLDDGASGNPPANGFRYRMWWLKDKADSNLTPPLKPDSGDVDDPTDAAHVYVTDFSSRELADQDQELDVLAPGSWVRGPFPGFPGRQRMPWYSRGLGDFFSGITSNFFYIGGTSMATPHVASVAALMLEKDGALKQSDVETIMKSSTLTIPAGSADVWDPFFVNDDGELEPQFVEFSWGNDATGAGLLLADEALGNTP